MIQFLKGAAPFFFLSFLPFSGGRGWLLRFFPRVTSRPDGLIITTCYSTSIPRRDPKWKWPPDQRVSVSPQVSVTPQIPFLFGLWEVIFRRSAAIASIFLPILWHFGSERATSHDRGDSSPLRGSPAHDGGSSFDSHRRPSGLLLLLLLLWTITFHAA